MSLRTKLAVTFGCCIALLSIAFWGFTRLTEERPSLSPPSPELDASDSVDRRDTMEPALASPDAVPAKATDPTLDERPEVPAGGWRVVGRIVSVDTKGATRPVAEARVTLGPHRRWEGTTPIEPRDSITDDNGRFELTAPSREQLELRVIATDLSELSARLWFTHPTARDGVSPTKNLGDITLTPAAPLTMFVRGPNGEAVANAEVLLRTVAGHEILPEVARTSGAREESIPAEEINTGTYRATRAPRGSLEAQVSAAGYVPATAALENPDETPTTIEMIRGEVLAGTVVDDRGQPIAQAKLQAYQPQLHETVTDANGQFRFDTLPWGMARLSVRADGFVTLRHRVSAGVEDAEITLAREATYSGSVTTAANAPLSRAKVSLEGVGEQTRTFAARTEPDGAFRMRKLPEGRYRVVIDHEEASTRELEAEVELTPGANVDAGAIQLDAGWRLRGTVIEASDDGEVTPIPGTEVRLKLVVEGREIAARRAESGTKGDFEIKGLVDGDYELRTNAEGFLRKATRLEGLTRDAEPVKVQLKRAGEVRGRVIDDSDRPIVGADVRVDLGFAPEARNSVWQEYRSTVPRPVRSDADGRFTIRGLRPYPTYAIRATHPRFAVGRSEPFSIVDDERQEDIVVRLQPGATVSGRVVDEDDEPIVGALVRLRRGRQRQANQWLFRVSRPEVRTGNDGSFRIENLPAMAYTLVANAAGRPQETQEIEVPGSSPIEDLKVVIASGYPIAGRVVDEEGNPVERARVHHYDGSFSNDTTTDPDGRFRLSGLLEGRVELGIGKDGFAWTSLTVSVPSDTEVLVTMKAAGTIRGRIVPRGDVVLKTPAELRVVNTEKDSTMWTFANDDRFDLELEPGTYIIRTSGRSFAPTETSPLVLQAGEVIDDVILELTPGATIAGEVVDATTGDAVPNATVEYVDTKAPQNSYDRPSATTQADGSFTFAGIPSGEIQLFVSHKHYARKKTGPLTTTVGETTTTRVELQRGGSIRGIVRRGGNPLPKMRLLLKSEGGIESPPKTTDANADGGFRFEGLAPGTYSVSGSLPRPGGDLGTLPQRVVVLADREVTVELQVPVGIGVTGQLRADGKPLGNIIVLAFHKQKSWLGASGRSDATGRYALEVPEAGSYTLLLHRERWRGMLARAEVEVPGGSAGVVHDIDLPVGAIEGTIIDAGTGKPIAQANVSAIEDAEARSRSPNTVGASAWAETDTDGHGRFSLRRLPPGRYAVRASARGFVETLHRGVSIDDDTRRTRTIELHRGVPLKVLTVDEAGAPIRGAAVAVAHASGDPLRSERFRWSNAWGKVEFAAPPGRYVVTAGHKRYAYSRRSIEVSDAGGSVTIALRTGGHVKVQVVDDNRRPRVGVQVRVVNRHGVDVATEFPPLNSVPIRQNHTEHEGVLDLGVLPVGEYTATAVDGDNASAPQTFTVSAGKSVEPRLVLPENRR